MLEFNKKRTWGSCDRFDEICISSLAFEREKSNSQWIATSEAITSAFYVFIALTLLNIYSFIFLHNLDLVANDFWVDTMNQTQAPFNTCVKAYFFNVPIGFFSSHFERKDRNGRTRKQIDWRESYFDHVEQRSYWSERSNDQTIFSWNFSCSANFYHCFFFCFWKVGNLYCVCFLFDLFCLLCWYRTREIMMIDAIIWMSTNITRRYILQQMSVRWLRSRRNYIDLYIQFIVIIHLNVDGGW